MSIKLRRTKVAAFAGNAYAYDKHMQRTKGEVLRTRAIAGPNPFQSAPMPSAAIVFRAQSRNPVYVPEGADCNRDFRTCDAFDQNKYRIDAVGENILRQEGWQCSTWQRLPCHQQ